MQFRIFNKSFLLKAFLKYFYICSVEHSCVKVQCRWRTWLPTAVPAPGCVQEKLSAFGAAACCFPFRDEASGGAGNAGRVSLYHGIFSDPDHSDFIHYLEVSAVVHNVWEKSLNILWLHVHAFLRGIFCTGLMSSALIAFSSQENETRKASSPLMRGADLLAMEYPVALISPNVPPQKGSVVAEGCWIVQLCRLGNLWPRKGCCSGLWVVLTSCRLVRVPPGAEQEAGELWMSFFHFVNNFHISGAASAV